MKSGYLQELECGVTRLCELYLQSDIDGNQSPHGHEYQDPGHILGRNILPDSPLRLPRIHQLTDGQ